MSERTVPINRQTGRRVVRVAKRFLSSEVRWRALALFALLIGLLFAMSGLNVVNSYVGREIARLLADPDRVWAA
jgi:vitamin B12/bleomycin/antimicrobial peptide transport system ATP-binding/permease protein